MNFSQYSLIGGATDYSPQSFRIDKRVQVDRLKQDNNQVSGRVSPQDW